MTFSKADIVRVLYLLWRRKWIGVAGAWIVCVVGWIAVTTAPNVYEAGALIYVNPNMIQSPLLRGTGSGDPGRYLDFLRNTLLSREHLEQVITLSGLARTAQSLEQRQALQNSLASGITLKSKGEDFLSISYRHREPAIAKKVVESILAVYADDSAAKKAERFLSSEITKLEHQLRAAEARKAEFHRKYFDILPLAGGTSGFEAARQEVTRIKADLAAAGATRDALQKQLSPRQEMPAPAGTEKLLLPPPSFANIADANIYLDKLRRHFPEQHPYILLVQRQIAELESRLKVQLTAQDSAVASLEARLADAQKE